MLLLFEGTKWRRLVCVRRATVGPQSGLSVGRRGGGKNLTYAKLTAAASALSMSQLLSIVSDDRRAAGAGPSSAPRRPLVGPRRFLAGHLGANQWAVGEKEQPAGACRDLLNLNNK